MARQRSDRRQRRLPPPTGGAPRPRPNQVTLRVGGYLPSQRTHAPDRTLLKDNEISSASTPGSAARRWSPLLLRYRQSPCLLDFPGLDLGPYEEVFGGVHHVAI